jgi:hypothetical protein
MTGLLAQPHSWACIHGAIPATHPPSQGCAWNPADVEPCLQAGQPADALHTPRASRAHSSTTNPLALSFLVTAVARLSVGQGSPHHTGRASPAN